eukprot:TRINITY_DN10406_c1_g1_i1.p1 TRINITY_DN10406_c1_g1~~TRINITY_DN10406_c1_g1_i1.p1  ORF type:complete len:1148 (+),score=259.03 TRINITY_DN10406_c1_g1_i1:390-3833(+)
MEMESSRRSMDRSRELASVKKPKLAVEVADRDVDRPFPQKSSGSLVLRARANERERDEGRDDPARYQHQHQQQEIVGQYKTALAELTFNSKPIITNLTIIAGENHHAAKAIAATVCSNILEVPSEQKLPSLYLLDSIVKNIGKDYIKFFAARLPEVFCKAYRQVDSSIHPGMRHLFGTWKGVFPHSALQIIEKELGFQHTNNGSSSGASTVRPDSQAQRPPHSIHVNPKYLARQRLQQSSRAKEISSDVSGSAIMSAEDVTRPDRTSTIGSTRPWTDVPAKMPKIQRPQIEKSNEPAHEINPGAECGDYEFISDLPRRSDLAIVNASERTVERSGIDKPWYGAGSNATDTTAGQRNGFDFPNSYRNYRVPRSAQTETHNIGSRSTRGTPGNWKNSEEEEYLWEDMNSRLTDGEMVSSRKDGWNHDDAEKPESLQRGKWMPLETEHLDTRWNKFDSYSRLEKLSRGEDSIPFQREVEDHLPQPHGREDIGSRFSRETSADSLSRGLGGQTPLGHRSVWPIQERQPLGGSNHKNVASEILGQTEDLPAPLSGVSSTSLSSSMARTGLQLQLGGPSIGSIPSSFGSLANSLSGSSGTFSHQPQQPRRPASPCVPSSGNQHPQSPSSSASNQHQQSQILTNHDHLHLQSSQLGQKPTQFLGQLNRAPHFQAAQDLSTVLPQNHIQSGLFRNLSSVPSTQPPQHLQSSTPSLTPFAQTKNNLPFSQHPQPELPLPQTQSQPSFQTQKSSQPSSFGAPQTTRVYSELENTNNPVTDILGQSSTGSILAAIMKSGLVTTNNPVSNSFPNPSFPDSLTPLNLNAQPPLPSGPPPMQTMVSSVPMVTPASALAPTSHANVSVLTTNALKAVLPPLPPGPPPPSSLVGTSSQGSSNASAPHNPLSTLLSSLVSKGLISAPQKEVIVSKAPNVPTDASVPVSSSSSPSAIPAPCSDKELFSESAAKDTSLSRPITVETKGLIGIEFKPEIIRELHPLVIGSIFDSLPRQCSECGLRFKLQEQLSGHMEWHDLKRQEAGGCDTVSRKWYAGLSDWVAGNVGRPTGPIYDTSIEGTVTTKETSEPMVSADESQCICALCGEPFEDFYSEDMDEWMYKGAVYMTIPSGEEDMGTKDESITEGPIVHANCISRSSMNELAVA